MLNILLLMSVTISLVAADMEEEPSNLNAGSFCKSLTNGGECGQGWNYECAEEQSMYNPGKIRCFCRCGAMLDFTRSTSEPCTVPPGPTCVHRCNGYYYEDGQSICSCRPDCVSSENCCPDFAEICTVAPGSLFDEQLKIVHSVNVTDGTFRWIYDLTVTAGLLLAVQRSLHSPHITRAVELDKQNASVVRVIFDGLSGLPRGIASTPEGDLYVTTNEFLLRVSADGHQTVVASGWYGGSCVDVTSSTVYATRITAMGRPVLVDVVINDAITQTIQTEATSNQNEYTTCGTTYEHDVLFLSSVRQNHIYKISLTNGSILATYGEQGSHVPGDVNGPRIGVTLPDTQQIIIADYYNDRLQVLNTVEGSFTMLSASIYKPRSVAVLKERVYAAGGDNMFILEKQD